jgi:hypothetical protein
VEVEDLLGQRFVVREHLTERAGAREALAEQLEQRHHVDRMALHAAERLAQVEHDIAVVVLEAADELPHIRPAGDRLDRVAALAERPLDRLVHGLCFVGAGLLILDHVVEQRDTKFFQDGSPA